MTGPELHYEAVRVARELEAVGHAAGCSVHAKARDDDDAAVGNENTTQVSYINIGGINLGVSRILLIQMAAIGYAKSKPALGINLGAAEKFNRIVAQCIR